MRITFCLNGPNEVNGPNMWLLRHLPLLGQRGAAPEVLYLSYDPGVPCRLRDELMSHGIRVVESRIGRCTEDTIVNICAALRDDPPDVFVPNYSIPAYYACRFLREAGTLTVGILHSDDPYYHDVADLFLNGGPRWRLSAVVAVSRYLASLPQPAGGGSGVPTLYAPCGTPVPAQMARPATGSFRIIYVGRIVEHQKRILRLAHRMCAIAEALQNVEVLIYGAGEQERQVADIVASRNCDGRVRLAGRLAANEVFPAMVQAQAFVLLSDFEGLSVALVEAMAAGLVPIVAPFRSGSTEVVEHGVSGYVVDPEDETALVRIVRTLASDADLWRTLSANARATIQEGGFSSEACATRWFDFCRDLCAGRERERKSVVVPPVEEWGLPPRPTRLDGARSADLRCIDSRLSQVQADARPVYLWGAGGSGRIFLRSRPKWRGLIEGVVDSAAEKVGAVFEGLPVLSPAQLHSLRERRPYVVITSQYEAEISRSLVKLGFEEETDFSVG